MTYCGRDSAPALYIRLRTPYLSTIGVHVSPCLHMPDCQCRLFSRRRSLIRSFSTEASRDSEGAVATCRTDRGCYSVGYSVGEESLDGGAGAVEIWDRRRSFVGATDSHAKLVPE